MRLGSRVAGLPVSLLALCLLLAIAPAAGAASGERRKLQVEDTFRIGEVDEPRISPDGRWLAYGVMRADLEEDEYRTRLWMVPMTGGEAIPLTAEASDSTFPRWSPDGSWLAFLSARDDDALTQVWLLYRQGGEAIQLTDLAQGVEYFAWSPDGSRMLLVLRDPSPEQLAARQARDEGSSYEQKTPPPHVVTRRQFKRDYVGYLDQRRSHLYVLDVKTRELRQLTFGDFDDFDGYCQSFLECSSSEPAWSPDGKRIAFVSNRTDDPDANYDTDVFVVEVDAKGPPPEPVRITRNPGPDGSPSWSRDGRLIAHTSNVEKGAASLYATNHLAVSSASGGDTRVLTRELDRMVFQPRFSRRDDSIWFLLEDSGEQSLARVPAKGGAIERMVAGPRVVWGYDEGPTGELVALVSEPQLPAEVFALEGGELVRRTHVNDELLASLRLGEVQEVRFPSLDGTEIEAFVVTPPGVSRPKRLPGILLIHGGPQAQHDRSFDFDAQLWAANGYVVVMPNPRGSTGYGQAFCYAIWQAWGERDYEDVMAAMDHAVEQGLIDPERMAVTGWSYGGMLTNHVITKTKRFKAAATGASAALYVVNFGHDHYQRWWELELGPPWEAEAREIYERMSPFNRVAEVETPTLILGGEEDWNVPIINSEQLFLALKIRGVPTELVVYPGEFHGIDTPSHIEDLERRYLAWFDRYIGSAGGKD